MATADSSAGKAVGDLHPDLAGVPALADRVFEPHERGQAGRLDLVFLALPAGQSAPVAAGLAETSRSSTSGRLPAGRPGAWARHYGGDPRRPLGHRAARAAGGRRSRSARPSRVAAPGCYATAAILALAPLVGGRAGRADDVVVVAASGPRARAGRCGPTCSAAR